MTFNCIEPTVVFQEVPDEISLCFSITGCKLACAGCHSTELWSESNGEPLTNKRFKSWLNKYNNLISCVVFFGGEWNQARLIEKLIIAKQSGLKTCLYSGLEVIDEEIIRHLDFYKTGRWDKALGGLSSPTTNQRFIDSNTGNLLNHLFLQN